MSQFTAITKFINSEHSLEEQLKLVIDRSADSDTTYICGGHFVIVYDSLKKQMIPAIIEDVQDKDMKDKLKGIGIFPGYTWQIACRLVNYAKKNKKKAKLVLLINDWQHVPATDRGNDLSLPNKFRQNFYDKFSELPKSYKKTLLKYKLNQDVDIFWPEQNEFYFREVRLRDRFARLIKSYFKKEGDVSFCKKQEDGNYYYCSSDGQEALMLHGGGTQTGCNGEIAQMLFEICKSHKASDLNIITFLPASCQFPVNQGTVMSYDIFKIKPKVVNIFFRSDSERPEQFYQGFQNVSMYSFPRDND